MNQPIPATPNRWVRPVLQTLLGILLYPLVTWFTSFMQLGETFGISLQPAIVIPMILGFSGGPVVGFLAGTLGNALSDQLIWGDGISYWHWSVANGLMGLIPGLYALTKPHFRNLRDYLVGLGVVGLGVVVGMAFPALVNIPLCATPNPSCSESPVTWAIAINGIFIPAATANLITSFLLMPLMLYNLENLNFRREDWNSGLFRRLTLAVVISATLPTVLLGFFMISETQSHGRELTSLLQAASTEVAALTQALQSDPEAVQATLGKLGTALSRDEAASQQEFQKLIVQILGTILLSLVFTVANSALLAQSFSRPLLNLTGAAKQMQQGAFSRSQAESLAAAHGNDEIAQLSQVFGVMARDVMAREESLKRQVEELRIEIDEAKRAKQVSEIVDSEFFQDLKAKAAAMRKRSRAASEETPNEG